MAAKDQTHEIAAHPRSPRMAQLALTKAQQLAPILAPIIDQKAESRMRELDPELFKRQRGESGGHIPYDAAINTNADILDPMADASGLKKGYEAWASDPEAVEHLAKLCADYSVWTRGRKLSLVDMGIEAWIEKGSITTNWAKNNPAEHSMPAHMAPLPSREPKADEEHAIRTGSQKANQAAATLSRFAKYAIHNSADPLGRAVGPGAPGEPSTSRGELNLSDILQGYAKSFVDHWARHERRHERRQQQHIEETCPRTQKTPSIDHCKLLVGAFDSLQAKVATRAALMCEQRIDSWMEENGLPQALALAQAVWGERACLGEAERLGASAPAVQKILAERGALGIFSLRASRGLGIDKIDEDLTGLVKSKMEDMGLSAGGWRRLAAMDPAISFDLLTRFSLDGRPPARERFGGLDIGDFLPEEDDDEHDDIGDGNGRMLRDNGLHRIQQAARRERGEADDEVDDGAQRLAPSPKNSKALGRFAKTLSAAAHMDMEPAKLASVCSWAFGSESVGSGSELSAFKNLLATESKPAQVRTIEEAQAFIDETRAKSARSPAILSGFLERCSTHGIEAAGPELSLIHDFLSQAEHGVWQELPEKPTWGQMMRRQKDWHMLVQTQQHGKPMAWESLVDAARDQASGYSAKALATGYDLLAEGKAMRHCVSSYAGKCHDGESRIFSVAKDGKALGTLELRAPEDGGAWQVHQFLGRCNARIEEPAAHLFAKQVAGLYQAAFEKSLAQTLAGAKAEPRACEPEAANPEAPGRARRMGARAA